MWHNKIAPFKIKCCAEYFSLPQGKIKNPSTYIPHSVFLFIIHPIILKWQFGKLIDIILHFLFLSTWPCLASVPGGTRGIHETTRRAKVLCRGLRSPEASSLKSGQAQSRSGVFKVVIGKITFPAQNLLVKEQDLL